MNGVPRRDAYDAWHREHPYGTPHDAWLAAISGPERCNMAVRAKFRVAEVTHYEAGRMVKMVAIYDTSTPENERFTKATPDGRLDIKIDNPAAMDQFKPGQVFYLDFTPA